MAEAYARNPRGPTSFRVATSLYAYVHGDYRKALEEALLIDRPSLIYSHMALAIAYAGLGKRDEAAAEVKQVLALAPGYGDYVRDDLAKRNIDPGLVAAIIDGLGKAGLKTTPPTQ
jgi:adenylate cyclase